jgi:SAM-dependent methyltransferase
MSDIHSSARVGYGREAATYARGRPDYPDALLAWLRDALRLAPGRRVADVGAGTGKFTRRLEATGAAVLAIEPVDAMRAELERSTGAVALAGTAQALPVSSSTLDAVTCAQAFHWFAHTAVLDEFARVLRPGGRLGLVWNVRDESVDWVRRITALLAPLEGDAPRFHRGDWRKPFPHAAFSPLRETWFEHVHVGPPGEVVVDRILSVSFVAAQTPARRNEVRAALTDLVANHPELTGRDTIAFPYRTVAFHCTRLPSP